MLEPKELQERKEKLSQRVDDSHWAINKNREDDSLPTTAFRALGLKALEIATCELQLSVS